MVKKWEDVKREMYKKDPGMKRRVEKEKEKMRTCSQYVGNSRSIGPGLHMV